MIKLLHTSDWHLGRIIYGHPLLGDQRHFINEIFFPTIEAEKPDAVIIAGDIYDKKIAPLDAIRLFDETLTKLCLQYKTPVFIISGNHDSGDRMAIGSGLLSGLGVHISLRPQMPSPVTITKDGQRVDIWQIPYFEPVEIKELLNDDTIKSFEDGYRAYIELIRQQMDSSHINIAVAHCFVRGSSLCDSESPTYIGGSSEISRELFSCFDYTALGHLHSPQGKDNVLYSGSPLKYSFDEQYQNKAMLMVEIDNEINIRHIPVKQPHDMRTVTGKFDDVIQQLKACEDKSDYLYIVLTDEVPIFEPMARLREHYPNILSMESRWINTSAGSADSDFRSRMTSSKVSDETVFSEFLRQICAIEPGEEHMELFSELMKEQED